MPPRPATDIWGFTLDYFTQAAFHAAWYWDTKASTKCADADLHAFTYADADLIAAELRHFRIITISPSISRWYFSMPPARHTYKVPQIRRISPKMLVTYNG